MELGCRRREFAGCRPPATNAPGAVTLREAPHPRPGHAHPKLGASWEGLALEHLLRVLRVELGEAFHWSTHGGAALDLLLVRGGQRWGFELKYADAPRTTKSIRVALDDLKLERLYVIYPAERDYALDDRIEVLALRNVARLRDRRGL